MPYAYARVCCVLCAANIRVILIIFFSCRCKMEYSFDNVATVTDVLLFIFSTASHQWIRENVVCLISFQVHDW